MTIMLVSDAIARLKRTSPESPLTVSRCNVPGCVNTGFANTYHARFTRLDARYLGDFHRGSDLSLLEELR